MSLVPIGLSDLGRRAAMGFGQPGFMAVVARLEGNAATRIATRLGHGAARLGAQPDAQALSARLHDSNGDPLIVEGLDRLGDEAWRQLDQRRGYITRDRLTVLVLSPPSAERFVRLAPNLASVLDSFFRLEETEEPPVEPPDAGAGQAEFDRLARDWLTETQAFSSLTRVIRHPAYQAIIAMGERAIRPILRDLARAPGLWGPALHAITGAVPVAAGDAGRVARVAEAWITWAKENGYAW